MFNDAAVHVCVLYLVLGCTLAQITHPKSWLMAKTARSARIECVVDKNVNLADTHIHWYQHREGDVFKRVLYIPAGLASGKPDDGFQGKFIGALNSKDRKSTLTITNVNTNDAASYYCAYYDGEAVKIFGSGTELFVTEKPRELKAPTVIAYPPSKPQNGKTTLLCVAMDMFPDIAKFKWKEGNTGVAGADKKVLEQKLESGRASMLIIDEIKAESKHTCTVEHEGNPTGIQKEIPTGHITEVNNGANSRPKTELPFCNGTKSADSLHRISDESFGLSRSLYLASLTYTLMILKSVGYFGVACLIMFKRSTNRPVKRI